jgi:hypothetical protein
MVNKPGACGGVACFRQWIFIYFLLSRFAEHVHGNTKRKRQPFFTLLYIRDYIHGFLRKKKWRIGRIREIEKNLAGGTRF